MGKVDSTSIVFIAIVLVYSNPITGTSDPDTGKSTVKHQVY